jgi:hypothetical protein
MAPDESVLARGTATINGHACNWAFRLAPDGTITSDILYPFVGFDANGAALSPSGAIFIAGARNRNGTFPFYRVTEYPVAKFAPEEPFTNDGTVALRPPPPHVHDYPLDLIHMELHGVKNKSYVIEGSSDLKTWREITRSEPGIVPLTAATENSAQFFRAHE